jgi:hypothetical protein
MDVEGAEVSALHGMRRTLARFRPRILMEVNRPALASFAKDVGDIWRFFGGLSYRLEAFVPSQDGPRQPIPDLAEFERLCPPDGLIDMLAAPG